MRTILYIDVYFLLNGMMDTVILVLTGRFLKRKLRWGRIVSAAVLGSVWTCVTAALAWSGFWITLVGMTLVAGLMSWIAYPTGEFREWLRSFLCLYLSAVLVGGGVHIFYDNTMFGRFWQLWIAGTPVEAISVYLLAAAMAAVCFAVYWGNRYREASMNRERMQEVTLFCQGRSLTVMALWDSGNQLQDPFTGRAVHVVEAEVMGALFDHSRSDISDPIPGQLYRLIPCRSLGDSHGLLPVLTLDRMILADGVVIESPVIGLSKTKLSADHSYQMLLHSTLSNIQKQAV